MCSSYISPRLYVPYMSSDVCAISEDFPSTCADGAPDIARICCCRLDGCESEANAPWLKQALYIPAPLTYWPFDS
jgi:hypothetical protein